MFRNRLYYHLKPALPPSVRMAIRRWFAVRTRERSLDKWPILPGSEKPPQGWPGWPDGKQFAFVLTHDVEAPAGLAKVRKLAELEMELGFRSSFNFIPEGDYTVPSTLRSWLVEHGFEVGVHDLHHDGHLYRSRQDFAKNAARINQYVKDWGAVGFRAGFMLHNPEWLHDLNVLYDASTFDTDPFEPQPDGVNTIFPFWVPAPTAAKALRPPSSVLPSPPSEFGIRISDFPPQWAGYVELPYTLPQDSTLFLLFRERHPDIWFQKLDWIAKHGGMALLNVHPDYVRFEGEPASRRTFPVEHYTRLLEYARQQYGQTFWHPRPRELAAFAPKTTPRLHPKPRRICMLTYSCYLGDSRVIMYAEALAERGDQVDVLALRGAPNLPKQATFGNVNLVCLQSRFARNEKSRLSYLRPILRFLIASSIWITRQHPRKRYDLFHIHNVPDFLVFAACLPKLTGAKVILDIHDIAPEFYASKFGVEEDKGWTISALKWLERASAWFADHVIISNHLWLEKYATRTRANGKCSVFINNVDARIFRPRANTRDDDKFIILFPGGLQWHQGLDIAIRAFQKVGAELPNAEFHIYGDGNMKDSLVALSHELGLDGKVRFLDPLPVRQIAEVMAAADLGVVPKRADSFGNEAYSTKIMEFMSLGVPVVVSSTKIDRYYFDDSVVRFFPSGDHDAMAREMVDLLTDTAARDRQVARAIEYARANSWDSRKTDYLKLVDDLCVTK